MKNVVKIWMKILENRKNHKNQMKQLLLDKTQLLYHYDYQDLVSIAETYVLDDIFHGLLRELFCYYNGKYFRYVKKMEKKYCKMLLPMILIMQ